jgi:hypothetical protein
VRFEEVTGEFQNWPVTPYKVHVRNEFDAKECFAYLNIDGQKVDRKFLRAGSAVVFEGIPTAEGMKEVSMRSYLCILRFVIWSTLFFLLWFKYIIHRFYSLCLDMRRKLRKIEPKPVAPFVHCALRR